jgi:hypothetical protein
LTLQEQDLLRIAAWDRFNASRAKLTALKSKVRGWAAEIQSLGGVCENAPLDLTPDHFSSIPTKEELQKTAAEICEAVKAYQRARQEAGAFGFPVGEDESETQITI